MGFWGYTKQLLWGILLFIAVPIGIYYLVKWDPVIGRDEGGEPSSLGYYVIFGVWWVALILILKYRADIKTRKAQIRKLVSGDMDETEKSVLEKKSKLEE